MFILETLFIIHIPVVFIYPYHRWYLSMYSHFNRCIFWMFSPSRRHLRTTTRVHFLSMHKDDIERAGIPGHRVFFDFCPNNVEKKRKEEKRREENTERTAHFLRVYFNTSPSTLCRDRLATIRLSR